MRLVHSLSLLLLATSAEAGWGGPDGAGWIWLDSNDPSGPFYNYLYAPTSLPGLSDDGSTTVSIGFSFPYYSSWYSSVRIHSNGVLSLGSGGSSIGYTNSCPLSYSEPAIAPFWDDLDPSDIGSLPMYYGVMGSAPNRIFVVEWYYMMVYGGGGDVTFEVQLHEVDGHVEAHYDDTWVGDGVHDNGLSATIGNVGPGGGLAIGCNSAALTDYFAIAWWPPISCTDNDGDGSCQGDDCDDNNPSVSPSAWESCDGLDNDCDGTADDGWDSDWDGQTSCAGDCNDSNPSIWAGAPELCNFSDDDCDGQIDEGLDGDGDGVSACGGDCNDGNPWMYAGAPEACNFTDDDCDGQVDEGLDGDGDGVSSCAGDCNDGNPWMYPGAPEACNFTDDDCDGQVDEGLDGDGDGWSACAGDCNDASPGLNPGATEIAGDGIDQDCDGADLGNPGDDDVSDDDTAPGDDDTTPGDDDTVVPGDDDTTLGDDDSLPADDDSVGDDDSTPSDDDQGDDDTAGGDDDSTAGDDDTSSSPQGDDDATSPGSGTFGDDDGPGVVGTETRSAFGCSCETATGRGEPFWMAGMFMLSRIRRRSARPTVGRVARVAPPFGESAPTRR